MSTDSNNSAQLQYEVVQKQNTDCVSVEHQEEWTRTGQIRSSYDIEQDRERERSRKGW
jgi:hypothetical protein